MVGVHRGGAELLPLSLLGGSPPSPTSAHGGDLWAVARATGRRPEDVLDVSANLHPWGAPPGVREACLRALDGMGHYPPPRAEPLRDALSERIGAPVVVGNGATELLVASLRGARRVRLLAPCYGGYAEAARAAGVAYAYDGGGDCIVVGRPNNPDGRVPDVAALARRWERVVVDESFLAFTGEPSCVGLAHNVIVVTSMTKTYGIPGLRLGWAWNLPEDAVPPWSVNAVALAAGQACVEAWDWPRRPPLETWRSELAERLGRWGEVCGAANFLLLRLPGPNAAEVRERALERDVLVRDASTIPGCDARCVRVAVRTPEENNRTIAALEHALG